jgi:hypothetical protein
MEFLRRRREFITLLGGAAAWPLAARAQQGERVRRIGVLLTLATDDPEGQARIAAFLQGLQQLGCTRARDARRLHRHRTPRCHTPVPSTKSLRGAMRRGAAWRLRWPRGRRLRRPWRQHGATHSRWILSSRTGTEVPSRIRRTIGSSASVMQGVNPRERGGYHRGWRAPLPKRKSTNPPANSCGREVMLPISNCSRN